MQGQAQGSMEEQEQMKIEEEGQGNAIDIEAPIVGVNAMVEVPESPRVRNRRYIYLQQLHKEGYFEEESLMLRHPRLYYEYVGRYKRGSARGAGYGTVGEFLQSQLISTEYRRLLAQQMQEEQGESGTQASKQEQGNKEGQVDNQEISPYEQQLEQISPEDLQMHEQLLIDQVEMEFLYGRLPGIDYRSIDEGEDQGQHGDNMAQDQYFADVEEQPDGGDTGIQDF